MNKEINVLILEDLPSDAELAKREVKKAIKNPLFLVVETKDDYIDALIKFMPDLIVSDYQLPAFDGMSALNITKKMLPSTPFIVLTGSMNEDTAVECMRAGAVDYVIKEHMKRLGPAVLNALEQKEIKLEKYKAQQQIKLLSKSIEKSPVIIVITDPKGNIEYVNPKFSELTDYTIEEVLGKNMRLFKSGKQSVQFYEDMWQTILSGKDWKGEMHNKRKNGELYWESVAISSISNQKGEITQFIGIKEDITAKKQLFEELTVAKRKAEEGNRLKTEFLHNMSHEIRTPMNGIMGFSDLLTTPGLSDEKIAYYSSIIRNNSDQLLRIIDDILEISTLETKRISAINKPFCLNDVINEFFAIYNFKAKELKIPLHIKKTLHDNESQIISDESKLRKIITNLLDNAFKFTTDGFIELGYYLENSNLILYVKDTGLGISIENRERIFFRFSQENYTIAQSHGGLGLGLSIAKENAQILGGDIFVESEKGKGSIFLVSIPYKPFAPNQ